MSRGIIIYGATGSGKTTLGKELAHRLHFQHVDIEQNLKFFEDAVQYDTGEPPQICLKHHEQWSGELSCPVLRVDGTKAISENAAWIADQFL